MPRTCKRRLVCSHPRCTRFAPPETEGPAVQLALDEYEVIRLIDFEGLRQEECAAQMGVARTTVQAIYAAARKKLAQCIVEARPLLIGGGAVRFCEHGGAPCGRGCCRADAHSKGGNIMRIAVTYENGNIFQHFGHTEQFKLYDTEENSVKGSFVVPTESSGHGALAGFLKGHQVDALICGGIGGGAQQALAQAGIKLYGGVAGSADEAVQALINGTLSFSADANCDHHGEGHHSCGEHHGCGHHNG